MSPLTTTRSGRFLCAALLLGWALLPGWAVAATSCTFTSSGGTLADFGTYFSLGGDKDVQGNVQLNCNATLPDIIVSYTLKIGPGLSGTALTRRMYNGSSSLRYNLFTDPTRTQIFGDGSSGTSFVNNTCALLCTPVPVYGRLYGSQGGTAGAYSDAVTVTVNF